MKQITGKQWEEQIDSNSFFTGYFGFDIRPFTSVTEFEGGETILAEGSVPPYLYYLAEGRAKVFLSHENGRSSLINFLDAPCFIGEMELLGALESSRGVRAITVCTCFCIHIEKCREQLLGGAVFLRRLCLFLGKKAVKNTNNYARNQSYPLEVRLVNFILMTEQNQLYREPHTEAAEYLGVSYRHLLYVLAGLVKRGLLEKTEQGYYIPDRGSLEKYRS